jgi:hypothetical protein
MKSMKIQFPSLFARHALLIVAGMFSFACAADQLTPSVATSYVHDAQTKATGRISASSLGDGANIAAQYDITRMMLAMIHGAKPMAFATASVQSADQHRYDFAPVSAPIVQYGSMLMAQGTWNVSRDGVLVCGACQGWASLTSNGLWVGVLDGSGNTANAWSVMLDGVVSQQP